MAVFRDSFISEAVAKTREAAGLEVRRTVGGAAYAGVLDESSAILHDIMSAPRFADVAILLTKYINTRMTDKGIDLQLSDITDFPKIIADIEAFAGRALQSKLGVDINTSQGLNQPQLLEAVGRVVANKLNQKTGSNLATVYPPERLQEELTTEAVRMLDFRADIPPGNLLGVARVRDIRYRFLRSAQGDRRGAILDTKHAMARWYQAKFRRSHRLIWLSEGQGNADAPRGGATRKPRYSYTARGRNRQTGEL